MKLYVSTGNSRMEKVWNGQEMELDAFQERISATYTTSETVEQYRKMPKAKQDSIKDVGGFVLGRLRDGRRIKDSVISRSGLTLDMDYATPDIVEQLEMLFPFYCLIYSTHKSTPEKPRLRLIIPLTREVTADEYMAVSRKVAEDIGIELFDDTTYEPSRLMYWPSTSCDGVFLFREINGDFLDPDSVLARYTDWHNTAEWPVSKRQEKVVTREVKRQADPLTKSGLVGAFCRTYSVQEAIEKFLPNVYQHSAMAGRFDYIPADSQAGVVIYEDKFAYSHHATDPACGKLLNAFDVVRIHKFGALDAKADEDTDAAKLPSFQSMQEFAAQDDEVKRTLGREREQLAQAEFTSEDDDWQNALELDKQGKVKATLTNIATIIRYDPNLQNIVFNEFKGTLDVIGPLPWQQVKPGWSDADMANAKLYFERVYGIWSPTKFKDALLAVVSAERTYHPVKDYLDSSPELLAGLGRDEHFPLMMKVLAVNNPLSLHVHPDRIQAQRGWREEELKRRKGFVQELNYKDENCKNELFYALTPSTLLVGFRDAESASFHLKRLCPVSFEKHFSSSRTARGLFKTLFSLPQSELDCVIAEYMKGLEESGEELTRGGVYYTERGISVKVHDLFGNDPSVVVPYLMNVIALRIGEVLYIRSGMLHSYIHGTGIEIEDSSDNEVRIGMSSKHKDVTDALNLIDYDSSFTGKIPLVPADECIADE